MTAGGVKGPSRTAYQVAFYALALLIALSYAALLRSQLNYGLEYDESYLLNVIRNIASGRGFVDDGASYFTSGEPFHPFISTGPTMLLPSALVWKLSGGAIAVTRLVPIAFFFLYLVATSILLYRWRGRWAVLAGLAGPLLLPVLLPDLTNRSVMPGRFVGEIAATALLMVMAVLLGRHRYAWAGLAGGLAIQTKFNFLLPVLVLIAVWMAGSWVAHRSPAPRLLRRLLPGLVLPTLLFEGYKLATLGTSGYANNVTLTRQFAAFNTVSFNDAPNAALTKLASLTELVSGPAILLCVVALGVFVGLVLLDPYLRPSPTADSREDCEAAIAVVAAFAGALSQLLWWALTSSQTSPRPAVPVVMLALSLVSATMVIVAFAIAARSDGRMRMIASIVPMLAIVLLFVCTAYQGVKIVRNDTGRILLDNQRQAAAAIAAATDVLPVDDFWTNPEFNVLTGLPYQSGSRDDPPLLIYTSIRALTERGRADATVYADNCGQVLFSSTDVLVCRPAI